MGFLDFLKKQSLKKVEFEDLDLPPAPPPLEEYDEQFREEGSFMPEELQPYPEDISKPSSELGQFELPGMAETEGTAPEAQHDTPSAAQYAAPAPDEYEPMQGMPFPHATMPERRARRHLPKTSYVNLNDLKDVLIGIRNIRGDLGISQDAFMIFDNIRGRQDRAYEKLNGISHDLQKKLIYMDKNLFKGEKA